MIQDSSTTLLYPANVSYSNGVPISDIFLLCRYVSKPYGDIRSVRFLRIRNRVQEFVHFYFVFLGDARYTRCFTRTGCTCSLCARFSICFVFKVCPTSRYKKKFVNFMSTTSNKNCIQQFFENMQKAMSVYKYWTIFRILTDVVSMHILLALIYLPLYKASVTYHYCTPKVEE